MDTAFWMSRLKKKIKLGMPTDEKNPTRFGEEFLNPRKDKF